MDNPISILLTVLGVLGGAVGGHVWARRLSADAIRKLGADAWHAAHRAAGGSLTGAFVGWLPTLTEALKGRVSPARLQLAAQGALEVAIRELSRTVSDAAARVDALPVPRDPCPGGCGDRELAPIHVRLPVGPDRDGKDIERAASAGGGAS